MAKKKSRVQKYLNQVERKAKTKVKRATKKAGKKAGKAAKKGAIKAGKATGRAAKRGTRAAYEASRVKPKKMIRDMKKANWSPQQIYWRTGVSPALQTRIENGKSSGAKYLEPLRNARRGAKKGPPDGWITPASGVDSTTHEKTLNHQQQNREKHDQARIDKQRKADEAKAKADAKEAAKAQAKADADAKAAKAKADAKAKAKADADAKAAKAKAAKAKRDAEKAREKAKAAKAKSRDKLQKKALQSQARQQERDTKNTGNPQAYEVVRGAEGEWVLRQNSKKTAKLQEKQAKADAKDTAKPAKITDWSQYVDKAAETEEAENIPTEGDQIVQAPGENTIIDSNGGSHLGNRVVQVILKQDN